MAVVFLTGGKATLDSTLSLIETAKSWASKQPIQLRVGVNAGGVETIRDINRNPNVCGHAINDTQRVMDAANNDGVLWSRAAVEEHFGRGRPVPPPPYSFEPPVTIHVKHDQPLLVQQLFCGGRPYWDRTPLASLRRNTFLLSSSGSEVGHLDEHWRQARKIALITIGGILFRERRLGLSRNGEETIPEDIEEELNLPGEPLGDDLEQIEVFVPVAQQYRLWMKENAQGKGEAYEKCILFWAKYLNKLAKGRARLIRESPRGRIPPFIGELREYQTLGCVAVYIDWHMRGGLIRGSPNLWGVEMRDSSLFETRWHPQSPTEPAAFREYVCGLNSLRDYSTEVYHCEASVRGQFLESDESPSRRGAATRSHPCRP
jgi:hypothetical protein